MTAPPTPVQNRGLSYLLATLAFTWGLQFPAVLAQSGVLPGGVERYVPLALLGGFGPVLVAVAFSYREGRGDGVRRLFRPLREWRVGAHWYVIAFGLFMLIAAVGVETYRLVSGDTAARWLYLPEGPRHLGPMILMPLVEEPGWRGYALPRLEARMGPLAASLVLGLAWAAWHTMMWILPGLSPEMFALAFVNVFAGSVIFSWIYHHTRGSLLLAIVAHAGVHLNNPFRAPPGQEASFTAYTVAAVVTAAALVAFDRRVWKRRA